MQFFKGKLVDDAPQGIDKFEIEVPDCGDNIPTEILPDCGDNMPVIEIPTVEMPDFMGIKAKYVGIVIPMKKKSACHPIGRRKH